MRTALENEAKIIKGNKSSHNCHTTAPGNREGEWCREGKSVRKYDFYNMHVFLVCCFFLITSLLETNEACPTAPTRFTICWVSSLEKGFSKEGQTFQRDKWPPLQKGGCVVEWEVRPPPRLVWFFKAAMPVISNHTFWASIRNCHISVFPSCYWLSHFRDQLRITVKRLSQQLVRAGKSTMPLC